MPTMASRSVTRGSRVPSRNAPSTAPDNTTAPGMWGSQTSPGGAPVTDAEWAAFLDEEVTPRFPDGLTVLGSRSLTAADTELDAAEVPQSRHRAARTGAQPRADAPKARVGARLDRHPVAGDGVRLVPVEDRARHGHRPRQRLRQVDLG